LHPAKLLKLGETVEVTVPSVAQEAARDLVRAPRPGQAEYFDLDRDPDMLHNLYATLPSTRRATLNDSTGDDAACVARECWAAGLRSR